jgi:Cu/Ag efflux protein CusF
MALSFALLVCFVAPVLAEEAKGKIKKVTADKSEFTFTDKDGKDHDCVLKDDGKVQLNDKDSKLNELKEGDEVTITYEEKDGKYQVTKIQCKRE